MSQCSRCGAQFGCAMADRLDAPCWCTELPPVLAVPQAPDASGGGCWCPACLKQYVAEHAPPAAP